MKKFFRIKNKLSAEFLFTLLLSVAIIASPLINNKKVLLGWELPKVYFWQLFCIASSPLSIIVILKKLKSCKRSTLKKVAIWTIISFFILSPMIVSALLSNFPREVVINNEANPLYNFLFSILGNNYTPHMSIFGNIFRDQGLITFLLLIWLFIQIVVNIRRKSIAFIAGAFITSALMQSIIGISQFLDIIRISRNLVTEGRLIYGTFGQSNFYSGHLLVGLCFSIFYLSKSSKTLQSLLLLSSEIIVLGILASFSWWGYFTMVMCMIYIISLQVKKRRRLLLISSAAITLLFQIVIVTIGILSIDAFQKYFRAQIWNNIIDAYLGELIRNPGFSNFFNFLFGAGGDTLGEVLCSKGYFTTALVDRAHNIFLDILASTGIYGLTGFITTLIFSLRRVTRNLKNSKLAVLFLITQVWLLRSLIHTSSIVNITDFVVLFGCFFALVKKENGC